MATVFCGLAAFAVASLFYTWRAYHEKCTTRQRTLRERVAFMLWVMASGSSR